MSPPNSVESEDTRAVEMPRPDHEVAPAVVVRDLTYQYPDGRHALRGLSFAIQTGETVALLGPNGAGKSTLLWHLNGLLPGRSTSAGNNHHAWASAAPRRTPAVWLDGLEVNEKNGREIRRRAGLLFQDPDDQMFSATVLDDVAFGPLNLGLSKGEAARIARECLNAVDLHDVEDRPPHHLSFGERKRACLAGLLACRPSVLLLDEPSANLDPRARRRFMTLIADLPGTKLIATHDLELALSLCARTIVLDKGLAVADGATETLLSDAALMEAHGLEVPASLAARQRAR